MEQNFNLTTIVFAGAPYSGKKTLMAKLEEILIEGNPSGTVHKMNAGDELKKIAEGNSTWAKTIKKYLEKRLPVQDVIMGHVYSDFMKKVKKGDTLLLNGFPRSVAQADWFDDEFVSHNKTKPVIVIHVVISAECSFNRMYNSPAGISKEELIRQFALYDDGILPIIDWFQNDNDYLLITVDGERPTEIVFEEIFRKIKNVLVL